jgi:hypothetical protein
VPTYTTVQHFFLLRFTTGIGVTELNFKVPRNEFVPVLEFAGFQATSTAATPAAAAATALWINDESGSATRDSQTGASDWGVKCWQQLWQW